MTALNSETAGANDPTVELHDIWVRYSKKWVLEAISLECLPGEILGIVGPNGGGKTTLLKVILGVLEPERGSAKLFGNPPDKHNRLGLGYLPQISQADRSFPVSVLDVVLMGFYKRIGILQRVGQNTRNHAMDLLSQVNMAAHAKRPFGHLSGGQQQRVNIARALASRPRLLVLDEPSTGVDTVAQEDFYELLAALRDEQNMSVIMVSHDIGAITNHADRVACLNTQLHYHGDPESCFTSDIQKKVFGKNLQMVIHDDKCLTCSDRHPEHLQE
jgi:zinc transport system ATP-binding protein